MRKFLFILFNLLASCLFAQNEKWYPGTVVTRNDEVINGEVLFHADFDVLVINSGAERSVLTGHTIKSFHFYDKTANLNRKFVSLEGSNGGAIYEIVLRGEISVLRRSIFEGGSDRDGYEYYFLHDGNVDRLKKFRSVLYPQLREMLSTEEKEFHLNPNLQADAIRYIEFYNRKSAQKNLVAAR